MATTIDNTSESSAWKQSAEYQALGAKFLAGINSGADVSGIQQEATTALSNFKGEGGGAYVAPPVIPPKPVAPAFNSQAYINQVTTAGNAGIDSADKARQALINARLQDSLSSQNGLMRDAEGNLVKQTETIQGNTYDAQETQRATGVQRGIQYSQQQQGIEAGISRAGAKMIVDAGKDRDTAILNIKDRIASLKSGASYEVQASQAQADSEKSKLLADATMSAFDRSNQVTDMQYGADRQDYTTSVDQKFQTDLQEKQFLQQGQLLDKTWNHDDEVKFEDRKYAEEQLGKQYTREDAVAEKAFDNQLTLIGVDQANKVELANLDFTQKKEFLKLDTQAQKDILAVKNKYDVDMFGMTSALQVKITGMQESTQMALGQLSANTQKSIADANIKADEAKWKADIASKTLETNGAMLAQYTMNTPGFNMYPKPGTPTFDAEVAKLQTYFTASGMSPEVQAQILKGSITINQALTKTDVINNTSSGTTAKKFNGYIIPKLGGLSK